jgi:hypothetical protein
MVVLFRTRTAVVLRRRGAPCDTTGTTPEAVVMLPGRSIALNGDAAELLASYLRVVRAYCRLMPHNHATVAQLHEQICQQLTADNPTAAGPISRAEVAALVERLGSAHEWWLAAQPAHVVPS